MIFLRSAGRWSKPVIRALTFVTLAFLGELTGLSWGGEMLLRDLRTAQVHRPASQEIVFVAIDARSLARIGAWPWPRSVHADLTDRLAQAGAAEIVFDIDFSLPSDPAEDLAFANAIERAGNVTLPLFVQADRYGRAETVLNEPIDLFYERAWPATVNITADRQGLVRDYPYGQTIGETFVPSMGAALSGRYVESSASFGVNFSIDPATLPVVSALDVIEGRIPDDAINGRLVVVGASAIELGDFFAMPIHGVLPGPIIHILAAETLLQGIVPREMGAEISLAVLGFWLLLLQAGWFDKTGRFLVVFTLALASTEAIVFTLATGSNIFVPSAACYLAFGGFSLWLLAARLNLRDWVIRSQSVEIASTQALMRQVFDDSLDAIVVMNEAGEIVMQSRSAEALFGTDALGHLALPEPLQRGLRRSAVEPDKGAFPGLREQKFACQGKVLSLEYSITPSSVTTVKDGKPARSGIASLSVRDVTALREGEAEIAFLSSYDSLTGALRRHTFLEFVALRGEASGDFAIFVLNLCRFKTVNTVLGRDIGDAVLTETVVRLETSGLGLSAPARLDGDTFAVFAENSLDGHGAADLAGGIAGIFDTPFLVEGSSVKLAARIGYALVPEEAGLSPAAALGRAEEALDAARDAETALPLPYNVSQTDKQRRARAVERAMDGALAREEFYLTYQPQHRLPDCQLIGSEALLRWHSATLGPVFPDEFIEIAEQSGFIVDLGRWILHRAMVETLAMPGQLSVAINVSGGQMQGNDIVRDVTNALSDTGFPASRLWLELTETVVMSSSEQIIDLMRDIQFTGAAWALDDFGTGYSSLAYLTSFPLEKVKLDRSFTNDLGSDPRAATILQAVSDICHGLDMKLLCEGVATAEHIERLIAAGCEEAQGYYFGKPMPVLEFRRYAENQLADRLTKHTG